MKEGEKEKNYLLFRNLFTKDKFCSKDKKNERRDMGIAERNQEAKGKGS